MINKEGKLFGKISIIDILALVVVCVLAFGVYTRTMPLLKDSSSSDCKIEYKITVKGVRMGTVDALRKSTDLYDTYASNHIGVVKHVEYLPYKKAVEQMNGELKMVEQPELYDVLLTVQVDGKSTDNEYLTNSDYSILSGNEISFFSKYANTSGKISGVRETD